jgi:hypothetical protein
MDLRKPELYGFGERKTRPRPVAMPNRHSLKVDMFCTIFFGIKRYFPFQYVWVRCPDPRAFPPCN